MVLRFSVSTGRKQGDGVDAEPWRVVDVPLTAGHVFIGRDPGSTIELPFATVSSRHARIFPHANGYRVEDLGSGNGTHLGTRRLRAYTPLPIAAGELLDLAGIGLRFDGELPDQDVSVDGSTATLARRLVHDVFSGCPPSEAVRLIGVEGPGSGRELALVARERSLVVGRGDNCDLVLCDEDVSREHAAFERSSAGIMLRDLGSKNGVEVQGRKVSEPCRLRDGDIISIGQTRLRLVDLEDRYLRQIQDGVAGPKPEQPSTPLVAGTTSVQASPDRLPSLATAVAVLVLLSVFGLVLALALG